MHKQQLFKMSNPKRIFLARHGESIANQQKLISGQLDIALSEKGEHQAQCLCEVLKNETLTAIYSSSLRRTQQTAAPTASHHGLVVQVLDELKEISFGELQGQADTPMTAALIQASGGESPADFEQRISHCLQGLLAHLPETSLIVGHRNTNAVILSHLLGVKAVNIKNKYVYEIVLSDMPSINTIRLGGEFHGHKFVGLKDD